MTQAEAAAELIKGSTATNSKLVTVRRDHLLIALGHVEPAPAEDATEPAKPASDVS